MIRDLNQGTPTTASQIPFGDTENGVDRRCSVSQLRDVILADVVSESWVTQYATPNSTGFSVTVSPANAGQSVWLVLLPAAGYAAGTIVLPASTALVDRQEFEVFCSQSVTTLTITASGATIAGAPASLTANQVFKLRYDQVTNTLYGAL